MPDHICTSCGHVDSDSIIEPKPEEKKDKFPRKIIRDNREFDNTYHPGVDNADLVHEVHRVRVSHCKPYPTLSQIETIQGRSNPKLLCHNCGWNTGHELSAGGYTSRLKVAYLRDNSAIWDLGPNGPWMLRDENNNSTDVWKKDYAAQRFIREKKPSIPLVEMHKYGGLNDKFHFTIMSRAKGSTIKAIWDTLTREQMSDVLQDLREHIKQWRQITSPQMQRVDGSELRDAYIGNCTGFGCIKTGHNEEEWLENLTPAMRKSMLWDLWIMNKGWNADQTVLGSWIIEVDEKVAQLKANFPRGGPYVLTHGDLHTENIFISDDNPEKKFKVSAIIDWELAGFFPWWVERFRAELPESAWEILGDDTDFHHPGYSEKKDLKDIWKPVGDVKDKWFEGGNHGWSKHGLHQANRWYRKPFCACKPYAQEYRDSSLGWEQEHMDVFDIDSSDSEDDQKEEDKRFSRRERQFFRWFKEISNHN
ncbi:uncharacterized protein PAC_12875 [Phialocephala subalpina]|uniref:Aminoglycoside phosphotransferase domain-containing protein n=1 Tax=Phialocephala subalpina TaxID=576137 RepID=A0A1L7XD85_9HELO|nr:uncharacterized protein PAC_12875 [Phialocephala subalpina]